METVKATAVPVSAVEPAAGDCALTDPTGTLACGALVMVPTTRPVEESVVAAALCVRPKTFGTVTLSAVKLAVIVWFAVTLENW